MSKKYKILIIDDDPVFRKTLTDTLKLKGYIPLVSESGESGLEIFKKEKPSIVLIDLKLEEMSGLEVLREIKKVFSLTECILLTGYATEESAIKAINLGAYGYLQKPYDIEQLFIMIKRAIEKQETVLALKKNEEWLRTVVEAGKDAMIAIDSNGQITLFNPAAEVMFFCKKEEMLGKSPISLIPERYRELCFQYMKDCFAKGKPDGAIGEIMELTALRSDGTVFPVEVTLSSGQNRDERFILALIRDITARKKTEKERLLLEKQLRQAQKMEAIGTLAGGIAHDFNNILGAILGYTELTLMDTPEGSIARHSLMRILKACQRAKELVNQILTFSRQKEEERKPVEIKLIAKEVLYLLRASLPSTIEFRSRLTSRGTVLADPTQIHQIILNLCTNAGHAMKEKGGILSVNLVDVEITPEDTSLIKNLEVGPYIKLTVNDTGCGMEREVMDRIFEPYFTTKEIGQGTGLGLSVVHGIVISHGGAIIAYSEPGKGTTFHVYFPRVEGEVKDRNILKVNFPRGDECILFVDDEKDIVDTAKMLLERLGYEVITQNTGMEALEVFRKEPDKFDLLITDQTMPGMTGMELAGKILSLKPDMPVILCSGFSDDVSMEKIRETGIREFLLKPVEIKDMSETIRKVLDNIPFNS